VTANTSKASSLFSDRIPASMMREPVQTLCYRARNAEMLFSWNDEAPVWAPKFRALLHEASCTSFFSASVTLVEYLHSCHGFRTLSDSAACRPFWDGGAAYSSGSTPMCLPSATTYWQTMQQAAMGVQPSMMSHVTSYKVWTGTAAS